MKVRSLILALAAVAPLAAAPSQKPKLSFVKDIVPIFTKSGCANSNCHGSIRGQAGFKLSLFGYEPDLDFDASIQQTLRAKPFNEPPCGAHRTSSRRADRHQPR